MQLAANVTLGGDFDWHAIDWKGVYRTVKNLRQRIFRASREGDLKKVRSLQRLMLRCRANILESVRRVSQVNQGRNTPGVDKMLVKTPEERSALCGTLSQLEPHKVHPVRRVYIPKKKGQRPLGIPTIVDRCVQAMVKNALEPFWEARFEGISYGFRPGRGCHDAIVKIFHLATPRSTRKWVLDADIEGAFNNIGHSALQVAIGNFPARELIKQWLKAGYVEDETLHPTETGCPQGGIISPLLLNIALHGMEQALGCKYASQGVCQGKFAIVRYADDFAVFCPSEEEARKAKILLADWLKTRGLQLSEDKTQIRHLSEGFDFLGFNVRLYRTPNSSRSGYKQLIKPSNESIRQIRQKLKGIWHKHLGSPTVALINEMNPVIRGWSNYFRIAVAKQVFSDLDDFMYYRAKRYMKRRHPTKSGHWRTDKYWGRHGGPRQASWVFMDKTRGASLRKFSWVKIKRHVMVTKDYSPDDPTLQDYWQQRRAKTLSTDARYRKLLKQQAGICPVCHQHLENGEELHAHHVIPKKLGGTDALDNLRLLHLYCHRQIHSNKAPLGVRQLLEPWCGATRSPGS
jgi:RNA-directed DNA polymerase